MCHLPPDEFHVYSTLSDTPIDILMYINVYVYVLYIYLCVFFVCECHVYLHFNMDFLLLHNQDWADTFLTFPSDDCAHMKFKVTDFLSSEFDIFLGCMPAL